RRWMKQYKDCWRSKLEQNRIVDGELRRGSRVVSVHVSRGKIAKIAGLTPSNAPRVSHIEEDVRRALAHKFPYSIYFVNEPDAIAIIAVLHQHRRAGAWKSRQ